MMWATIRRKVVSAGSSALTNYGSVQSLERTQPALARSTSQGYVAAIRMSEALNLGKGSEIVPQFNQGAPVYSKPSRDVISSVKTDFSTQKWIRSFSSFTERSNRVDTSEVNMDVASPEAGFVPKGLGVQVIRDAEKMNGPVRNSFTLSGGVYGSLLAAPIVNPPQVANLGIQSTLSSTFLPNLALFWHINSGIEEILADYVHHEMTRNLILVLLRLFLIVVVKDVFVATN